MVGAGLSQLIRNLSGMRYSGNRLKDETEKFVQMFSVMDDRPKPRILCIGMTGSGKTAEKFILTEIILKKSDIKNPLFIWWKAPPTWIETLEKNLPDYHRGHHASVRSIIKLDQPGRTVILFMDEASRDMGNKNALDKKSRRFEKGLSLFRQKNTLFHGGTQIGNVTKGLRMQADIIVYRGNTPVFITESDDSFAREHQNEIVNLMNPKNKKYCLFTSSYSYFLEDPIHAKGNLITEGKLNLDLFEWCPYWKDEEVAAALSNGYSEMSFDSEFDEFAHENDLINDFADLFEEEFPNSKKPKFSQIKGWLRRKYPETYHEYEALVSSIRNEIDYRVMIDEEKRKSKEESKSDEKQLEIQFEPGMEFPDFLKMNLLEIDKVLSDLAFYWASGLSYRDIYPIAQSMHSIGRSTVNKMLKEFCSKGVNGDWTIRAGYFFEKWFANRIGGRAADPESHDPDVIGPDGRRYSLKCYNNSENSVSIPIHEFGPSLRYAQESKDSFTALAYFPKFINDTEIPMRYLIIEYDPALKNIQFLKFGENQYFNIPRDNSNVENNEGKVSTTEEE